MGDGDDGSLARNHLAGWSIKRSRRWQVFPARDDNTDPEEPAQRQPGADNEAVEAVIGLRPPRHVSVRPADRQPDGEAAMG